MVDVPTSSLVTGPGMRAVPDPTVQDPGDVAGPGRVERTLGRVPGLRLAMVPARVAGLAANAWVRGMRRPVYPEMPAPRITPGYLGSLVADELVVGIFKSPRRFPTNEEMHRVGSELREMRAYLERGGFLDDPASWHVAPPAADARLVRRKRLHGVELEHLSWPSGFEPRAGVPGGDRWRSYHHNEVAHAWVARHPEPGRPWILCLHGLGTGHPMADAFAFRVRDLVQEHGANVVMPVLHAVSHAMWDVRSLLGFLRGQGATRIGVHGVSLGGYCTALLSGLDDDLDFAIAGIPLVDVPGLYATHAPPLIRRRAISLGLIGDVTHQVHRVISPLALESKVPHDRRAIYAGLGDRMSTAAQAHRLWEHWGRPRVHWYGGNHVGFVFNREVRQFVDERLRLHLEDVVTPGAAA